MGIWNQMASTSIDYIYMYSFHVFSDVSTAVARNFERVCTCIQFNLSKGCTSNFS